MQRKTQTLAYWQKQFTVNGKDIEPIYNQIIEENRLYTLDEIAISIVTQHCEAEEQEIQRDQNKGPVYKPKENYEVGDTVVFPMLKQATGQVQEIREGNHPEYGTISIMAVKIERAGIVREFVINFNHPHLLNNDQAGFSGGDGSMSPESIYATYQKAIKPKIQTALATRDDLIEYHNQYYLKDLLTEIQEGLFNIADAAIDINQGPMATDDLIEQMGLVPDKKSITDTLRFSISYHLDQDERFHDVGPDGQSSWYLERLEPPEVHHKPRRLQGDEGLYDVGILDDTLLALLIEIDDELTHPDDTPEVGTDINDVTIVLNYPHRRVGTLPLTPKTQSFFPVSQYNPVRFEFVDGRTGDTFPGWSVLNGQYVFGLDEWYTKNKLPAGAYITLKRGKKPLQVIIDYQPTRTQREWIRMAAVSGHSLTFQMNKEAISCKYDDLMVVGERDHTDIDKLWLESASREVSLFDLMCRFFPELSKLNPQSTVHAKTLYSAINIIRRTSPGSVFQELMERECFIPVDHGYWTYDPSLKS